MNERVTNKKSRQMFAMVFLAVLLLTSSIATYNSFAQPSGATIINNATTQGPVTPAASLTTAGGSFTTLVLNGSFQTQKWKAYIGNVTGILTLDDSTQTTIYDWNLVTISGEVYVSRNDSVTWSGIDCVNNTVVSSEDSYLNINSSREDSINMTFNDTIHKEFYVGTTPIGASSCRSIATYINDTAQSVDENAKFQEVMLTDVDGKAVFASILENNALGYNDNPFDFQLIVPEDETKSVPTPYYFYVEIS